jgi:DNA mismatch endonuclease (patch repair protein)
MPDVVSPATRSRMMAGIRGKDTAPELLLRRSLHRRGFRYRLHVGDLPGKPDMVFPARHAVILIHGCFWHGHNCHLFKWPGTRPDFWLEKIEGNRKRDEAAARSLSAAGWRILTVWECAIKGRERLDKEKIATVAADWLVSGADNLELKGIRHGCTG